MNELELLLLLMGAAGLCLIVMLVKLALIIVEDVIDWRERRRVHVACPTCGQHCHVPPARAIAMHERTRRAS